MTAADRLRTLAGEWDAYGLGGALEDVARQIERERACDEDAIENVRLIVGRVIDDMDLHVSGVEGMDDSPVARWARELRRALRSDASDGAETQNPSCADSAETADVTSDAQKLTSEDRDAIAWVRNHGGLGRVKSPTDWVVEHCSTNQQLDFDFWLSGRVMYALGFDEDMADREEVERRLHARLMAVDALRAAIKETCARAGAEHTGDTVRDAQSIWRKLDWYKARLGESVPRAAYERHLARRQRQIDESHAALRRRNKRIAELHRELDELDDICGGESVKDTLDEALNLCATIGCEPSSAVGEELIWALGKCTDIVSKRLMPEGMEWLLDVWPKWSNGEYCKFGDWWTAGKYGKREPQPLLKLAIYTPEQLDEWGQGDGEHFGYEWDFMRPSDVMDRPDKVEPPTPKVLDADGVETRVGDTVYGTTGQRYEVTGLCEYDSSIVHVKFDGGANSIGEELISDSPYINSANVDASKLTHRAPVLAADGRPLREGETVYEVDEGTEHVVDHIEYEGGGTPNVYFTDGKWAYPDLITHERPESRCRDCAHWQKDPTADNMGVCWFLYHEYEGEDCYAAKRGDCKACSDLVRRARALAGGA